MVCLLSSVLCLLYATTVSILCLTTVVQCAISEYTQLYGGVVAQAIHNTSLGVPDIAEAVRLAARHAKLTGVKYSVTNMEKQRLFFTSDGISPYLHHQQTHVNGKLAVQRRQLVVGAMYSFTIRYNSSSQEEIAVHFTLSRDRNKEYHVFKQIYRPPVAPSHLRSRDSGTCTYNHPLSPPCLLQPQVCSAVTGSSASLRVASYNIWNVNGLPGKGESYSTRLKRLGEFISSLDVDVFGFQEVRLEVEINDTDSRPRRAPRKTRNRPVTQCQVDQLSHQLPDYQFVFQPAMLYMERMLERREEGLAVFSRYPIVSTDYRLLSQNSSDTEDTHQRICLHAELLVPQLQPVHIFVSHLSLSSSAQERSVVEIYDFMKEYSGIKFLMGDLNAEPHSRTMMFLTGSLSLGGAWTNELYDTWTVPFSNINKPGLTFSALEPKTVKRIDYILASLPPTAGVHVAASEVVHDRNICSLPCSDHHMIMAVIDRTPEYCI